MTPSPDDATLSFVRAAKSSFAFLEAEFGAGPPDVDTSNPQTTDVLYRTPTTGVLITFEQAENQIYTCLVRLRDGEVPSYLRSGADWAYVDALMKAGGLEVTRKAFGDWLTADDVATVVDQYANGVRRLAAPILRGDFSAFEEISVAAVRSAHADPEPDRQISKKEDGDPDDRGEI